jgi:hypothetical protein
MVVIALLLVKVDVDICTDEQFQKKSFQFFQQNSKTFLVHEKNKYLKKN